MTGLEHPVIHGSGRFECGVWAERVADPKLQSPRYTALGNGVDPRLDIYPRYALRRSVGEKSRLLIPVLLTSVLTFQSEALRGPLNGLLDIGLQSPSFPRRRESRASFHPCITRSAGPSERGVA